jgi:biopolymer transport protein ExbB
MTRTTSSASPTQLPSLPRRAWRGIAALLLSLMLAPVALADVNAPAQPAAAQAPLSPAEREQQAKEAMSQLSPEGREAVQRMVDSMQALNEQMEANATEDNSLGMSHDLSPWGMYQNADIIVKAVMIGLAIASIITWTIWIAKGFELLGAKRRLRTEIANLK